MPLAGFWFENAWIPPALSFARRREIQRRLKAILAYRIASQGRTRAKPKKITEKIRIQSREYKRIKRATDPHYRIKSNLSSRLSHVLRGFAGKGKLTTLAIVGCSRENLMLHIEKQFQSGMAWNNYGAWEIDHITPCCYFNFAKEEDIRRCFHFSNLRPLWKRENRSRRGQTRRFSQV